MTRHFAFFSVVSPNSTETLKHWFRMIQKANDLRWRSDESPLYTAEPEADWLPPQILSLPLLTHSYPLILSYFFIMSPIWTLANAWCQLRLKNLRWPVSTSSMEGWLQRRDGCQGPCQPLSPLIHPSRVSGVHLFPWAPADIALHPLLHSSQAV